MWHGIQNSWSGYVGEYVKSGVGTSYQIVVHIKIEKLTTGVVNRCALFVVWLMVCEGMPSGIAFINHGGQGWKNSEMFEQ